MRSDRTHQGRDATLLPILLSSEQGIVFVNMKPKLSVPQLTRAEQETQTEAERLNAQIEHALAAVAVRSNSDTEDLEACADRLERAARDLAVALRELAHERRRARAEE